MVDTSGHSATLPIITNGAQTFSNSATGFTGTVHETAAGTNVIIRTPSDSGVSGLTLADSQGDSFLLTGFANVAAALSGASAGSLTVTGAQNAQVTLGQGNYNVLVSAATPSVSAILTAGSGTDTMTFVGPGTAVFNAGSGTTVINGGSGPDDVIFGTGTTDVKNNAGADNYTFHAGDGTATIETFSVAMGDVLNIDKSLQGSLSESVLGGSTLLSFGSGHSILLGGVTHYDVTQIHWT